MMASKMLSSKLKHTTYSADGVVKERLTYWCQGCKEIHAVIVKGEGAWGWNGDAERPVFTPSVLYERNMWMPPVTLENIEQWRAAPWPQEQRHHVCHTFIGCNGAQPGEVIFLGDCTHELRGAHPLPDLPDRHRA